MVQRDIHVATSIYASLQPMVSPPLLGYRSELLLETIKIDQAAPFFFLSFFSLFIFFSHVQKTARLPRGSLQGRVLLGCAQGHALQC